MQCDCKWHRYRIVIVILKVTSLPTTKHDHAMSKAAFLVVAAFVFQEFSGR